MPKKTNVIVASPGGNRRKYTLLQIAFFGIGSELRSYLWIRVVCRSRIKPATCANRKRGPARDRVRAWLLRGFDPPSGASGLNRGAGKAWSDQQTAGGPARWLPGWLTRFHGIIARPGTEPRLVAPGTLAGAIAAAGNTPPAHVSLARCGAFVAAIRRPPVRRYGDTIAAFRKSPLYTRADPLHLLHHRP
jgi:hypothetical protein